MKKRSLRRLKKAFSNLLPVVGAFLVIFGVFGLVFVQKPLQESQDIRPDASVGGQIASCNQACAQNADCNINFRCFKTEIGPRCRLATNPSSNTCSPATYNQAANPVATDKTATVQYPEKGDLIDPDLDNGLNNDIDSGPDIEPSAPLISAPDDQLGEFEPTPVPTPDLLAEEEQAVRLAAEQTAMDTLKNLLKDGQFSLPIIVLIAGIAILALSVFIHLLKSLFKRKPKPGPNSTPVGAATAAQKKNVGTPGGKNSSPIPVAERKPALQIPVTRPQAGLGHPHHLTLTPRLNDKAPFSSSGSMVERMKTKGIQVPSNETESGGQL